MELNPVVHYNDSLNFKASNVLVNIIARIKGQLVHKVFLLLCVTTLYSMKLFSVTGKIIGFEYIVGEIIFIIIALWILYYNVKMMQSIIVTIASQVTITNDMVSIAPFNYRLPFETKKQQDHLEFKINELKIRKADNPSMFTRSLGTRMFLLKDKEKEAYITDDYFDKALKEKLTEILIEVTPPELLIPGRLRHH